VRDVHPNHSKSLPKVYDALRVESSTSGAQNLKSEIRNLRHRRMRLRRIKFKTPYTASLRLENVNSLTFKAGIRFAVPPFCIRNDFDIISMFFSMATGLSLNRKFLME